MSTDDAPKPHCLGLLHQVNEWTWRAAACPPITEVDYAKLDDALDRMETGALDREAAYERAEVEAYQKDFDTITDRLLVGFRERGLTLSEGIRDPSCQSSSVGRKAEAAKMVMVLSPCCRQLQDEAFRNGELPIGWEPDAEYNFPAKPIRNVGELTEYLHFVLGILREHLSDRTTDDAMLDDIRCELRNSRRAMRAWGITLPTEFNDKPADIHEAERQLELLIDGFAFPVGDANAEANGKPPKPAEQLRMDKPPGGDLEVTDDERARVARRHAEAAARTAEFERRRPVAEAWERIYHTSGCPDRWLQFASALQDFTKLARDAGFGERIDAMVRATADSDTNWAWRFVSGALDYSVDRLAELMKERASVEDFPQWPFVFNNDLPMQFFVDAPVEPPSEAKSVETQAETLKSGDGAGGGRGDANGEQTKEPQRGWKLAYYASSYVEGKLGRRLAAEEVWDYWKEYGFDPADRDTKNAAELAGYEVPPSFETFKTYLSKGRAWFDDRRNEDRKGRRGRSIVDGAEID